MNTDRLIDALAQDLAPAPPLRSPWARAARWTTGVVVYLAAMTLMMASFSEIAANVRDWSFGFAQIAAALAGFGAAWAAFASIVPAESRRGLRFALCAALVWVGGLSVGAVQEWARQGVRLATPSEWGCVAMIVAGGALPAIVIARMLRQGAPLAPSLTAGTAALASTSLASVAACLSHPHPSDMVTLVWHGTTILAAVGAAALAGRSIRTWNMRLRARPVVRRRPR